MKMLADLITFIIIWIIVFIIITLISGCSILQPDQSIVTTPSKPIDQMWEGVKKSNWLITASIVGIAVGTFAFVNGSKMGLPAIASCCVSLFMTLAVARFATWMAICGLIGAVVACGVSILLRKRALVEIIKGVQEYKYTGTFDPTTQINTALDDKDIKNLNGVLIDNQSKSTQKQVQQIKANLKLKGKI